MVKKALVVGVDVGKDNLAVAFIAPSEKEAEDLGEWSNRRKKFSALAKKLQKIAQKTESEIIEIVIEPTGGYEKLFVQFCIDQD